MTYPEINIALNLAELICMSTLAIVFLCNRMIISNHYTKLNTKLDGVLLAINTGKYGKTQKNN